MPLPFWIFCSEDHKKYCIVSLQQSIFEVFLQCTINTFRLSLVLLHTPRYQSLTKSSVSYKPNILYDHLTSLRASLPLSNLHIWHFLCIFFITKHIVYIVVNPTGTENSLSPLCRKHLRLLGFGKSKNKHLHYSFLIPVTNHKYCC